MIFFRPASARAYKIGVVGNNWLVGNAVFSETARRIFLIFCIKLRDCKVKKVTEPDLRKGLQISPKSDTLIFFSKAALTIFLVFGLKLVRPSIQMKRIFQKSLQFGDIWPWNCQKITQIEVFGHFLQFALLVFLDFPHNGRLAWCLAVFLQFVGPVMYSCFCYFYFFCLVYIKLLVVWTSIGL